MKITVVGTGYVGLVTGACFSKLGYDIVCVDKDTAKIDDLKKGIVSIYEPGLEDLVQKNIKSGNLKFTTNLKEALEKTEAVFIAVGTPSRRGDGHADLAYVFGVVDELAENLSSEVVIVTKSTVPVGTGREIYKQLKKKRPDLVFHVASNPEFLREWAAIEDFMHPNRVMIGVDSVKAKNLMARVYNPLCINKTPIIYTSIEAAELTKYASNGFLAMKISFINEIADLCEKCGADVKEVARGIGFDDRIGDKFLHVSPGYGGSCFPKDTKALSYTAQQYDAPLTLIDAVIAFNEARKKSMGLRIESILGSLKEKKLAILGLTFKPNTDDMRDSASLDILPYLIEKGSKLNVFDPKGMKEAKKLLGHLPLKWKKNSYETLEGVDAVVILTEWDEFRFLDLNHVKKILKSPVIIDLRNMYDLEEMHKAGFEYHSLGRKIIKPMD